MSKKIKKIVIVGGGSAGWMTASTLIARLPGRDITLIESPNIPTIGVGESTLGFINGWLNLLGIKDEDFMPSCNATYKLSIRFTDFYKKGAGSFHYPFGGINVDGNTFEKNDWYFKKMFYPETPVSDYADCIYPIMALVNQNKITSRNDLIPNYSFKNDAAYHFNAVQFAIWLKNNYAIPRGVKNILAEVKDIHTDEDGIKKLILDSGEEVIADLYIDCTGFKSVLYSKMNVTFNSLSHVLPNNSAWATHIDYTDKRKQLVSYTDGHAIENGWVWNIPHWDGIGTGYVYSDKYIDDDTALQELKNHLKQKGILKGNHDFKKLKFRVGVYNKLWEKNVVPIGLSAGFIEPLESNGLYSVHMFLVELIRILDRDQSEFYVNQFDKDSYNYKCRSMFESFAEFVALHYALSHRDDTEYWRDIGKRIYSPSIYEKNIKNDSFVSAILARHDDYRFNNNGINCIATGLNYFATDKNAIDSYAENGEEFYKNAIKAVHKLNEKRDYWKEIVKDEPNLFDFLKERIYHGK
jgi:tryptophan halogenase